MDAVVVGAGHNGLVAATLLADAGWDVAGARGATACRRRGALRPVAASGLRHRLVQRVLPARRRVAGARALDLDRTGCAGRTPRPCSRTCCPTTAARCCRATSTSRRRRWTSSRAGDGAAWSAPGRAVRADPRTAARRAVHAVPAGARRSDARARHSGAPTCCASSASPCSRCGAPATSCSTARAGRCCWPATRCTPTCRPRRRPARSTAGCWRCWARPSASRFRSAASGGIVDALVVAARVRPAASCARRRRSTGSTIRDGQVRGVATRPPASGSPTRTVLADVGAPFLFEHADRRRTTCRRAWSTTSTSSSGTPDDEDRLGAVRRRSRGRPRTARGAGTVHLGADMNGLTRYAGDLGARTCPRNPFVLLGQMTTSDPTRSPAGHRVGLGLHPRAGRARVHAGDGRGTGRAGRGGDRAQRARVRAAACSPATVQSPGRPAGRRRQPGRRRGRRRHGEHPPAAGLPPGARPRAAGDADRRRLPGQRVGPSRRRRARRAGCERRPGRAAPGRATGRARRRVLDRPYDRIYR